MDRKYDDIDPLTSWERKPDHDTLKLYIPGFKKEQLKVQVTSKDNLKISGERPIGSNRWSRFLKELPIPPTYDRNKITARFEDGTLYVNHPKIAPKEEIKPPSKSEAQRTGQAQPAPQTAAAQDSKSQDVAATTGMNKEPSGKVNGMEDAKKFSEKAADKGKESEVPASEKDSEETWKKGPAEERKTTGADMDTGKNLEDAAKLEKTPAGVSSRKDEMEKEEIKQGFGGLITKMKQQPRKTTIVLMALLFLLLAVIYSKNTKGESAYEYKN